MDIFEKNFFRLFGAALALVAAFWLAVIVVGVLVLKHFGIL